MNHSLKSLQSCMCDAEKEFLSPLATAEEFLSAICFSLEQTGWKLVQKIV